MARLSDAEIDERLQGGQWRREGDAIVRDFELDGFTAAIVCLAAYTVHLATALILRSLERNPTPS